MGGYPSVTKIQFAIKIQLDKKDDLFSTLVTHLLERTISKAYTFYHIIHWTDLLDYCSSIVRLIDYAARYLTYL